MVFKKGENVGKLNTFYGKRHSAESRAKISLTHIGKHYSPDTEFKRGASSLGKLFKKGHVPWMKGKHPSLQTREKQRLSHLGIPLSLKHIENLRRSHIGKHRSLKTREKLRLYHLGLHHSLETREKLRMIFSSPRIRKMRRISRMKQRLPFKDTSIERKLQQKFISINVTFTTHKPILNITQPDIFIEPNICIYADGDYWHNLPGCVEKDKRINSILEQNGFKVFRFWEHEINKDVSLCVKHVSSFMSGCVSPTKIMEVKI